MDGRRIWNSLSNEKKAKIIRTLPEYAPNFPLSYYDSILDDIFKQPLIAPEEPQCSMYNTIKSKLEMQHFLESYERWAGQNLQQVMDSRRKFLLSFNLKVKPPNRTNVGSKIDPDLIEAGDYVSHKMADILNGVDSHNLLENLNFVDDKAADSTSDSVRFKMLMNNYLHASKRSNKKNNSDNLTKTFKQNPEKEKKIDKSKVKKEEGKHVDLDDLLKSTSAVSINQVEIPLNKSDPKSSFFGLIKHILTTSSNNSTEEIVRSNLIPESVIHDRVVEFLEENSDIFWCKSFDDQNTNYSHFLSSALNYLSGKNVSEMIYDFVPMIGSKIENNKCIWYWKAVFNFEVSLYQSDSVLFSLCRHWASCLYLVPNPMSIYIPKSNLNEFLIDSSDNLNLSYHEQELKRFGNPTLCFEYISDESGEKVLVGPVRGVYTDLSLKPRDHNLLIADRFGYISLLTLVRDAIAQLKDSIGTRKDICNILMKSRYLVPNADMNQVMNMLSGALDRLHSEKDPCCKYDPSTKMWRYLYVNRSLEQWVASFKTNFDFNMAKKTATMRKSKC